MSSKHTPGPWMVSFDASRYGIYQCDVIDGSPYRRTPIAFVPKIASAHACDEAERRMILQDARLIAAAPDLLEFAQEVRRSGDTRLASMAIALIAKAEAA